MDGDDKQTQTKLRWGLLGLGDIAAKMVAPCMKRVPEVQLIAASRRDVAKLRDFAEKFNVPRIYADTNSLLNDSEVEAIYVATPHNLHCQHVMEAAHAGKHILVEKPMAMTAEVLSRVLLDTAVEHMDITKIFSTWQSQLLAHINLTRHNMRETRALAQPYRSLLFSPML